MGLATCGVETVSFLDQELISYRDSSSFSSCWGNLFKQPKTSSFQTQIEMKFGRIVLQVNVHRLMSQIFDLMSHFEDGSHGVISGRRVAPPGE